MNALTSESKGMTEEHRQFCLALVELTEKFPGQPDLVRRATLDTFSFAKSPMEAAYYLRALAEVLLKNPQGQEKMLRVCRELSLRCPDLVSAYLSTAEKVTGSSAQPFWESFLVTMQTMLQRPSQLSDFLTTVRHLSEDEHFHEWNEFFNCTRTILETNEYVEDFFWTVRCLIKEGAVDVVADFFKMSKTMKNPHQARAVWEASRHVLQSFTNKKSCAQVFYMLSEYPQYSGAFAFGQLDSKQWLIDEALRCWGLKEWGTVFILGGWVGLLPRLLVDAQIETLKLRSFDIDREACRASELLNQKEVQRDWFYKSSIQDVTSLSYPATYKVLRKDGTECELSDQPDVVINTSCEHFPNLTWWHAIPSGTRVILQTNDGFHIPDHVSCFKSLEAFEKSMNLSRVEFRGQKALPEFNRFMLIGKK